MASRSNIFCCLRQFSIFKCGRIIYWFFDKWVEFREKLLGANFMVIGRSSLSLFSFVK